MSLVNPCTEDEEQNGGGPEVEEDTQFAEFIEWAMNTTLEKLLEWFHSQQD